ncbi:hypothetical protein ACTXT7_007092 [Hymenolepis weldensis]
MLGILATQTPSPQLVTQIHQVASTASTHDNTIRSLKETMAPNDVCFVCCYLLCSPDLWVLLHIYAPLRIAVNLKQVVYVLDKGRDASQDIPITHDLDEITCRPYIRYFQSLVLIPSIPSIPLPDECKIPLLPNS